MTRTSQNPAAKRSKSRVGKATSDCYDRSAEHGEALDGGAPDGGEGATRADRVMRAAGCHRVDAFHAVGARVPAHQGTADGVDGRQLDPVHLTVEAGAGGTGPGRPADVVVVAADVDDAVEV